MKKQLLLTSIIFLFLTGILFAGPHLGTEMYLRQPDGSKVKVKVYGDEFHQRIETPEGYTLTRDENSWICYAKLSEDKATLLSTGIRYGGENISTGKRAIVTGLRKSIDISTEAILKEIDKNKSIIHKGQRLSITEKPKNLSNQRLAAAQSIKGITILVDFSDEPAQMSREMLDRFFNQQGFNEWGNNGSVRDYYYSVSGGLVEYNNVVFGCYRALQPKSYYDSNVPYGKVSELITEALQWVDQQGFDFNTLSSNDLGLGYKTIKAINIMYTGGPTWGWGQGLWPHQGYYGGSFKADGVSPNAYMVTNVSNYVSLGTTCHENGHMLFSWPDLYDNSYDGPSAGLGNYCLMANMGENHANPVPPNPYLRALAGWETLVELNKTQNVNVVSNTNTSYKYTYPDKNAEYFLIESRTKDGRNTGLPDEGLVIWHVDEGMYNNQNQQMTQYYHYKISLEQADGLFSLEQPYNFNLGGPGDLFKAGYKDQFTDNTLPDAKWWDGNNSYLSVTDISAVGPVMTMKVTIPPSSQVQKQFPPFVPNIGSPVTIEAEDFDIGGEEVAYHDNDPENISLGYRQEGVDIEPCVAGGYNLDWSNSGEWTEYTIYIPFNTIYKIDTRVASAFQGGAFHLEFNGVNKTGTLVAPVTGGWQNWTTISVEVPLLPGMYVMRFYIESAPFNTDKFIIAPIVGNGLNAYVYNGMNFEDLRVTTRFPSINMDWQDAAPFQNVNADNFSIRFTGQILAPYTEEYTFYMTSDNGRRVWINNQLIIDKWIDDWDVEYQGKITLVGGQKYDIKVEYFDHVGGANCKLDWSTSSIPRETMQYYNFFSPDIPYSAPGEFAPALLIEKTPSLTVSPNPANDYVKLAWEIQQLEGVTITIVNTQGSIAHTQTISTNSIINTSHLANGIYTLLVKGKKSNQIKRLIIKR